MHATATRLARTGRTAFYGMTFHRGAEELADGSTAGDGWSKGQGGFRADWTLPQDVITFQGDAYRGTENQLGKPRHDDIGANAVARWRHQWERADLQVQAYFDQSERSGAPSSGGFLVRNYDVEIQQNLLVGQRPAPDLGRRGACDPLRHYGALRRCFFLPASRTLSLGDALRAGHRDARKSVQLTAGSEARG